MKQIQGDGICWFCDKECESKWYWHTTCKDKFLEENT